MDKTQHILLLCVITVFYVIGSEEKYVPLALYE